MLEAGTNFNVARDMFLANRGLRATTMDKTNETISAQQFEQTQEIAFARPQKCTHTHTTTITTTVTGSISSNQHKESCPWVKFKLD